MSDSFLYRFYLDSYKQNIKLCLNGDCKRKAHLHSPFYQKIYTYIEKESRFLFVHKKMNSDVDYVYFTLENDCIFIDREDGPAIIEQYGIVDLKKEAYIKRDVRHNSKGPAIIRTNDFPCYYYHGVRYDDEKHWFGVMSEEDKLNFLLNQ